MYSIISNKYNLSANQLFAIGKRDNNAKRNFLFVSKLLGKHLAVKPEIVRATGYLLSSLKYKFDNADYINCIKNNTTPSYDSLAKDNDVLVIGFCETATALGMSVAMSIDGATYIATTREPVCGIKQLVTFEETHSHASTHFMFSNNIQLSQFKKLILVDDEITTGNSLLHLIGSMVQIADIEDVTVLTILDWRDKEHQQNFQAFASAHGIALSVHSLVSGNIVADDNTIYQNTAIGTAEVCHTALKVCSFPKIMITMPDGEQHAYLTDSGRFGITYRQMQEIEDRALTTATAIAESLGKVKHLMVLGHGENMYIPSRVAANLSKMGYDVMFKTTSRTPIFCDGTLFKDGLAFYEKGAKYHFYNIQEAESYDKVIMLCEDEFPYKLCNNMLTFKL